MGVAAIAVLLMVQQESLREQERPTTLDTPAWAIRIPWTTY